MSAGKVGPGRRRRWRVIAGAAVCGLLAMFVPGGGAAAGAAAASGAALAGLSGPHVFGGGFSGTTDVCSDGTHVWVANELGNSVTELNAATGALVQVISGFAFKFDDPVAVSSDGADVWVPNEADQSVTGFLVASG